jgi:hypothetical protein
MAPGSCTVSWLLAAPDSFPGSYGARRSFSMAVVCPPVARSRSASFAAARDLSAAPDQPSSTSAKTKQCSDISFVDDALRQGGVPVFATRGLDRCISRRDGVKATFPSLDVRSGLGFASLAPPPPPPPPSRRPSFQPTTTNRGAS